MIENKQPPMALGGWLIVLIIQLMVAVGFAAYFLAEFFVPFLFGQEGFLSQGMGSSGYGAPLLLAGMLVLLGFISVLITMALDVFALVFIFRRSRRAPRAVILTQIFGILNFLAVLAWDLFSAQTVSSISASDLFFVAISVAWISYFRLSERVRATFVR